MPDQWIMVRVHPRANKDVLVALSPGRFEAWVRAKPLEGQANVAVTALLARTLQIAVSRVRLVKGSRGTHKLFQLVE